MVEHTPGPWEAVDEPDLDFPEVLADGWPVFLPGPIDGTRPDRTREVASANARLVAAAPDLLAACKRALAVLENLERYEFAPGYSVAETEGILEGVIAKAVGSD